MPRSDLLLSLVRAGSNSDKVLFHRSLEAIVAEERRKQHHVLADRLSAYLQNGTVAVGPGTVSKPQAPGAGNYVVEMVARLRLEDLILSEDVHLNVNELLEEQSRQALLRAHGLEPRHKLLLTGPPGNGKTSLAEAIAEALALPFVVVRYEEIIGSYLGETASRLKQVFDWVRSRECVLFFDEFDTLGKERGDAHDTGEIKRVVSTLLLQVDALPSYVLVVTATNHPELLDRAVWRRFDLHLEMRPPSPYQLREWISRLEVQLGEPLTTVEDELVNAFASSSFSDLESFASDVLRRRVLDGQNEEAVSTVMRRLHRQADYHPRLLSGR